MIYSHQIDHLPISIGNATQFCLVTFPDVESTCSYTKKKDCVILSHEVRHHPPPLRFPTAPPWNLDALFVWQRQCRSKFPQSPHPSLPTGPPSPCQFATVWDIQQLPLQYGHWGSSQWPPSPPLSLWASRMKSRNCNWQESRGNAPFNQHSCWIKLHTLCVCRSPSLGISEG